MYNLIIYLYLLGVAFCSLFKEKVRKMWRGERDAFRVLREKVDPKARYVWFHAASLGEFEQGRPLIEEIRQLRPDLKILLTFFSPSGYEVRKNYEGADIICYLPLDTIRNARRFLSLIRPEMAFFIKYEFWYNYLHILKHRNVPVYSVSSIFREGQVFFRWYGRQYGQVLKCFSHFYVQNEKSRELLASIGLTNVTITGDTRFDRVLQIKEKSRQLPVSLASATSSEGEGSASATSSVGKGTASATSSVGSAITSVPKVFVAGSSWPPDEDVFIRYFNEHRDWTLIIAPHVIGEDHLSQILKKLEGWHVTRYTQLDSSLAPWKGEGGEVLLVDCFGLLSSIYRYATVTYVGGGFGVGIHNVLEAAVWGKPVVIGPNNKRFQEAQELLADGGCFEITGYDDFARLMDRFTTDKPFLADAGSKAAAYVEGKAGATGRIISDVF